MVKHDELSPTITNKSITFNCPLSENNDIIFVRTGSIKKSSFLHSILYGYSSEYATMDSDKQMKTLHKFKASLIGKISKDDWRTTEQSDIICKIPFQENTSQILQDIYNFISTKKTSKQTITELADKLNILKEIQLYTVITEMLPLSKIQEIINNVSCTNLSDIFQEVFTSVKKFINGIPEIKKLSQTKIDSIQTKTNNFINKVMEVAEDETFKKFLIGESVIDDIDEHMITLISERINRNIYFLNSKTKLPYQILDSTKIKPDRKNMILISFPDNYYEIVGQLSHGNRIQRNFQPNDILVDKLYNFIYNPEEIHSKYPDLLRYLPKYLRTMTNDYYTNNRRKMSPKSSSSSSDNVSDTGSDNVSDNSDTHYDFDRNNVFRNSESEYNPVNNYINVWNTKFNPI